MRPCKNPFDTDNFTVVQEVAASPAVATNYIGAVPVNARSTLAMISFRIVADANAANRYCEIQLHRGSDVYILGNSLHAQALSEDRTYLGFHGCVNPSITGDLKYLFGLPDIPLFLEGDTVRIIVTGIQAGDQLSDVKLTWKVWPYEQ